MKFKIGDKVMIIDDDFVGAHPLHNGDTGIVVETIISCDIYFVRIKFDKINYTNFLLADRFKKVSGKITNWRERIQ